MATIAAVTVMALAVPAQAMTNGGFETGDFSGWTVADQAGGSGSWFVYSGTTTPINGFTIAAPPQGTFAAVTDQTGGGSHVLYRIVRVPPNARLSFFVYYENRVPTFCSPPTLDFTTPCNQQYRIDLLRSSANPFSVAPADVLRTLFATQPGDPVSLAPTLQRFNLSKLAGQRVMLRVAETDNQFFFNASVDRVTLRGKRRRSAPPSCTTRDVVNC